MKLGGGSAYGGGMLVENSEMVSFDGNATLAGNAITMSTGPKATGGERPFF